jgi:hypothetical protein
MKMRSNTAQKTTSNFYAGASSWQVKAEQILLVSGLFIGLVAVVSFYSFLAARWGEGYREQYRSQGAIAGALFQQFELAADAKNANALRVLSAQIQGKPLPSDDELRSLAVSLGIDAFYVIDSHGKFIRSSSIPLEQQTHSFFDFSDDYAGFLNSARGIQYTPVVPGDIFRIPVKFAFAANSDRTLIFESAVRFENFGGSLRDIVLQDSHILSVALLSPTARPLGHLAPGGPTSEQEGIAQTPPDSDDMKIDIAVPASVQACGECLKNGTWLGDSAYKYTLRLHVSQQPLLKQLFWLRCALATFTVACGGIALWLFSALGRLQIRTDGVENNTMPNRWVA